MLRTTLNKIKSNVPYWLGKDSYLKYCMRKLNKTEVDDEYFDIGFFLDRMSVSNALILLSSIEGHRKTKFKIAIELAKTVTGITGSHYYGIALDIADEIIDKFDDSKSWMHSWEERRVARMAYDGLECLTKRYAMKTCKNKKNGVCNACDLFKSATEGETIEIDFESAINRNEETFKKRMDDLGKTAKNLHALVVYDAQYLSRAMDAAYEYRNMQEEKIMVAQQDIRQAKNAVYDVLLSLGNYRISDEEYARDNEFRTIELCAARVANHCVFSKYAYLGGRRRRHEDISNNNPILKKIEDEQKGIVLGVLNSVSN